MLIKQSNLLRFHVKIEKNGILESENKDQALLISLSTALPKH